MLQKYVGFPLEFCFGGFFFDLSIPFFGVQKVIHFFFKGLLQQGGVLSGKKHPGWFGLVCLLGGLKGSPCDFDLNE